MLQGQSPYRDRLGLVQGQRKRLASSTNCSSSANRAVSFANADHSDNESSDETQHSSSASGGRDTNNNSRSANTNNNRYSNDPAVSEYYGGGAGYVSPRRGRHADPSSTLSSVNADTLKNTHISNRASPSSISQPLYGRVRTAERFGRHKVPRFNPNASPFERAHAYMEAKEKKAERMGGGNHSVSGVSNASLAASDVSLNNMLDYVVHDTYEQRRSQSPPGSYAYHQHLHHGGRKGTPRAASIFGPPPLPLTPALGGYNNNSITKIPPPPLLPWGQQQQQQLYPPYGYSHGGGPQRPASPHSPTTQAMYLHNALSSSAGTSTSGGGGGGGVPSSSYAYANTVSAPPYNNNNSNTNTNTRQMQQQPLRAPPPPPPQSTSGASYSSYPSTSSYTTSYSYPLTSVLGRPYGAPLPSEGGMTFAITDREYARLEKEKRKEHLRRERKDRARRGKVTLYGGDSSLSDEAEAEGDAYSTTLYNRFYSAVSDDDDDETSATSSASSMSSVASDNVPWEAVAETRAKSEFLDRLYNDRSFYLQMKAPLLLQEVISERDKTRQEVADFYARTLTEQQRMQFYQQQYAEQLAQQQAHQRFLEQTQQLHHQQTNLLQLEAMQREQEAHQAALEKKQRKLQQQQQETYGKAMGNEGKAVDKVGDSGPIKRRLDTLDGDGDGETSSQIRPSKGRGKGALVKVIRKKKKGDEEKMGEDAGRRGTADATAAVAAGAGAASAVRSGSAGPPVPQPLRGIDDPNALNDHQVLDSLSSAAKDSATVNSEPKEEEKKRLLEYLALLERDKAMALSAIEALNTNKHSSYSSATTAAPTAAAAATASSLPSNHNNANNNSGTTAESPFSALPAATSAEKSINAVQNTQALTSLMPSMLLMRPQAPPQAPPPQAPPLPAVSAPFSASSSSSPSSRRAPPHASHHTLSGATGLGVAGGAVGVGVPPNTSTHTYQAAMPQQQQQQERIVVTAMQPPPVWMRPHGSPTGTPRELWEGRGGGERVPVHHHHALLPNERDEKKEKREGEHPRNRNSRGGNEHQPSLSGKPLSNDVVRYPPRTRNGYTYEEEEGENEKVGEGKPKKRSARRLSDPKHLDTRTGDRREKGEDGTLGKSSRRSNSRGKKGREEERRIGHGTSRRGKRREYNMYLTSDSEAKASRNKGARKQTEEDEESKKKKHRRGDSSYSTSSYSYSSFSSSDSSSSYSTSTTEDERLSFKKSQNYRSEKEQTIPKERSQQKTRRERGGDAKNRDVDEHAYEESATNSPRGVRKLSPTNTKRAVGLRADEGANNNDSRVGGYPVLAPPPPTLTTATTTAMGPLYTSSPLEPPIEVRRKDAGGRREEHRYTPRTDDDPRSRRPHEKSLLLTPSPVPENPYLEVMFGHSSRPLANGTKASQLLIEHQHRQRQQQQKQHEQAHRRDMHTSFDVPTSRPPLPTAVSHTHTHRGVGELIASHTKNDKDWAERRHKDLSINPYAYPYPKHVHSVQPTHTPAHSQGHNINSSAVLPSRAAPPSSPPHPRRAEVYSGSSAVVNHNTPPLALPFPSSAATPDVSIISRRSDGGIGIGRRKEEEAMVVITHHQTPLPLKGRQTRNHDHEYLNMSNGGIPSREHRHHLPLGGDIDSHISSYEATRERGRRAHMSDQAGNSRATPVKVLATAKGNAVVRGVDARDTNLHHNSNRFALHTAGSSGALFDSDASPRPPPRL